MKNFIFVSPNFPDVYYKFVIALKMRGYNVLGIGDGPYYEIPQPLKENITEYYYVPSLGNVVSVEEAVRFFINKYGPIEYLESNNEYWLMQDAHLREMFNIPHGLRPCDMDKIKYKSKMKQAFKEAGVKVARYILVNTIEESLKFIEEVGYPVFVKPDNGVGAANSFAIHNIDELKMFHQSENVNQYIMEEYIEGEIVTFDGICDENSNVLVSFNEHFPISNADVVNLDIEDYYYALADYDEEFKKMGERVVKSFGIKKRCFHIEFFKLSKPRPGLADINEIVAIEVNMRPPGGNTPDILSYALNASFYDCYADIIEYNEIKQDLNKPHYVAVSVARKDRFQYVHSVEDIQNKYHDHIKEHGRYNKEIALCMGDEYFFGVFDNTEEMIEFKNYIQEKFN